MIGFWLLNSPVRVRLAVELAQFVVVVAVYCLGRARRGRQQRCIIILD